MKKTYIFFQKHQNTRVSYSIDSWKLFLTSWLGGQWRNSEIKSVVFTSQNDILDFWKHEEALEYAQIIVLCSTESIVSNENFVMATEEKFSISSFIPKSLTDKNMIIFDSITISSACYDKLEKVVTRVNNFMAHQLPFYCGTGKVNDVFESCLKKSLPGSIVIKPSLFSPSLNLPSNIADFILNSGDRGIVPFGARLGLFPYPVEKLLRLVNSLMSKEEQYCCVLDNDNCSFPLAVLHWIK